MAMTTTGDEVSIVLQHFRPKPFFVQPSPNKKQPKATQRPGTTNINAENSGNNSAITTKKGRTFSSAFYCKEKAALRLAYRHDRIHILRFQVQCDKPYAVSLLSSYDDGDDDGLAAKVRETCCNLNDTVAKNGDKKEISLFSKVSKLLLALNKLPHHPSQSTRNSRQQSALLRNMMISMVSDSYTTPAKATGSIANTTTTHNNEWRESFDLKILLLRYAAAGRHASTFCAPIPDEFQDYRAPSASKSSSSSPSGGGAVVPAANLVLAATTRLSSSEFCSSSNSPSTRQQPQQQERLLNRQEQELLAFLMSLADPTTAATNSTRSDQTTCTTTETTKRGRTLITTFCWNVESMFQGDESPRFAQLAQDHGVATAYHGTKMENVWSILHCGFQSLSDTRFVQNGGIFGKGVYFSTRKKVASYFAADHNPIVHPIVWKHLSLINLLGLSSPTMTSNNGSGNNNTTIHILDDYTVACFPVFEAKIILPPNDEANVKVKPEEEKTNLLQNFTVRQNSTRREGTYLVVPNPQDIRITKLYLTVELEKKRKIGWFLPLIAVLVAGIAVWYRLHVV